MANGKSDIAAREDCHQNKKPGTGRAQTADKVLAFGEEF
jgi:hypothetical protein